MKSTFRLFTLVLMAMSVFSCSKESVKEFEDEINQGAVTITAGINNDAKTKTTLGDTSGESTKVYWEEGDSFILTIGGEDYTFEIDPAYSNENPSTYATFTCADAPEKIAAGDYVAKYSNVATPTQQAGTKEGLSDYQYMEAAIDIDTERNLEDVSIKFYTKVSVVELTLTHDDFKGATVSDVALKNAGDVVAQSLQSTSFTGDSEGNIVVYFAVPAGKEFTAATITAKCDDKPYSATINSALTTVEGKLYQVEKSMTQRNVIDSGTCGANLKWELTYTDDENSLTLSITGTGDMYNYTSGTQPWILFLEKIKEVTTANTAASLGTSAFEGAIRLAEVHIGAKIDMIEANVFAGCDRLRNIYCYPTYPPIIRESSFARYDALLYIPCDYLDDYVFDRNWKKFENIQCAGAEKEEIESDGVDVDPSSTSVTMTWPTEENAYTYTIEIHKDGALFCRLVFNTEGQLLNLSFAPGRDGNNRPVLYAEQVANGSGLRFTVTGLNESTHYTYDLRAKDQDENTLQSHSGEFITKSNVMSNVDNINASISNVQKLLRDGQLIILRDGVEYNAMGAQIQ